MREVRTIGIIFGLYILAIMYYLEQSKFSRQVDDNRFFVEFYPLNGELTESFLLRNNCPT